MKELGIVLDFKEQWITIDEIKLPMRNLKDLQDPYQSDTRLPMAVGLVVGNTSKIDLIIGISKKEKIEL